MRYKLFLCLFLSLACSKREAPASPEARAASDSAADTAPATEVQKSAPQESSALPSAATPSIELSATGEAPRRMLRWEFSEGSKDTIVISMQSTSTWAAGTSINPAVIYEVSLKTDEVTPGGEARVGFTIANVEVSEPPPSFPSRRLEVLKQSVGRVKGKQGTYLVDARGVISDIRLDPNVIGDEGVKQLMRRLLYPTTVPVPEEKVGAGATWTVKRSFEESGIRMEEVATIELKKLEGRRLHAESNIDRTAPEQVLTKGAGVPLGGTLTVLGVVSVGHTVGDWDLTRLAAASAKTQISMTRTTLVAGADGISKPMEFRRDTVQLMTRK